MNTLSIPDSKRRWDCLSLGEVMLRLDPGEGRIHTARQFQVWEGGGEYNVARGLRRCFGLRTAVATALADNPVGRLVEDFILQGGVDTSLIRWVPYDGVGRTVRNGLNFTERGFGVRAAAGCSDRGHTAISQVKPGDFDWESIFGSDERLALAAYRRHLRRAFRFHRRSGRRSHGRRAQIRHARLLRPELPRLALEVDRRQSQGAGSQPRDRRKVDVLLGNEEDFSAMLGITIKGVSEDFAELPIAGYEEMLREVAAAYPNLKLIASTLRTAQTASRNAWGAIALYEDKIVHVPQREIEILDRVGGGDSFASGLIYGLLAGKGIDWAVRCGVAHGALAMTTPGDTSMATLAEVERIIKGGSARIAR